MSRRNAHRQQRSQRDAAAYSAGRLAHKQGHPLADLEAMAAAVRADLEIELLVASGWRPHRPRFPNSQGRWRA